MTRFVDRKPNDRGTISALVVEEEDTFPDVLQTLDAHGGVKVIDPHDRSAPVQYWIMVDREPRLLSVSEIELLMRTGQYDDPRLKEVGQGPISVARIGDQLICRDPAVSFP